MTGVPAATLGRLLAGPIEPWRLALIADHLAAVRRLATKLDLRYPGRDAEPAAMQALYLAALTYRPGPAAFETWFRVKLLGQTANFRRAARRRAGLGVRDVALDAYRVDSRYYYMQPEADPRG